MNEKYKNIHGFKQDKVSYIYELDADCYEFTHEKSGAHLIFLDRDDENKTFAIGFKTVPKDNTGVFHILEHCVLCGSRKYPVKDPMTELLKGSLYTYLNAFTYPDKTVYPVSSKNGKAFLDLVDVYMDAVFHPLAPTNEYIFMSEGHRTEYAEDGELSVNGIVYNEMKGAYSSPEELCDHYISESLFSGGTYSYDSGGYPECIPTLTFDDFCEAHASFYHPENSCIFLDGRIDVDKTLAHLDSYLSEFERRGISFDVTLGTVDTNTRMEYYPIEKNEDAADKTRLTIAWRGYDHADYEEHLAVTAILDGIADTNSSPLKARILASGLCENMYLFYSSQSKMSVLTAQFINVKDGACEELISLFDCTIADIIDNELDAELIKGSLKMLEFKTREADFGSYPRGMVYMSAAIENFFYGEAPEDAFKYDGLFSSLNEKLEGDFFSQTFKRILNSERTVLIMSPECELADREDARLRAALLSNREAMSPEDESALRSKLSGFEEYISTDDTDEALATIPTLTLADIGEPELLAPTAVKKLGGVEVIEHAINTSGIVYTELFFDVSDIFSEDISALRLMTLLLPELDTAGGTAAEFRKKVKRSLGDLSVFLSTVNRDDEVKLYLTVKASCLAGDVSALGELLSEYLYTSDFHSKDKLKRKLSQLYTASSENITADAVSTCISRVSARYSPLSALRERLFGYEFHKYLKDTKDFCDGDLSSLLLLLEKQRDKYFSRERLTVSVTAEKPECVYDVLLSTIRHGTATDGVLDIPLFEKKNEGIALSSSVGYAVLGGNLSTAGESYTASLSVLSTVLTYEYLWGEIRVKGGAYDTGAISKVGSGALACYSYRDPTPEQSVKVFAKVGKALRSAISERLDIEKYIISTLGAQDTVTTPRSASSYATTLYLSNKGENYISKTRAEILGTDESELIRLSSVLDRVYEEATVCVAGARELIKAADTILEI